MVRIRRAIVLLSAIVFIVMVLFPPYAAMKLPKEENVHAFIGYHPIWNPPNAEYAYKVLSGEPHDPADGADLSNYIVMFNKVRFIFNFMLLLLISLMLQIVSGKIWKRNVRPND
jgi:hypothetical protein